MYDHEKSDPAIVAVKPTNKAGQPAAELAEPRAGTEGNVRQQSTGRAQYRGTVSQALERIRQLQGKGRRRSSPRSSITSVLITSKKHSPNSKRMLHPGWMGWHVRTTSSTLSAILRTCMLASIGERIGRYRRGGFTYPSRMVGNARSRSPPLRTRLSRGPRLRC